MWDQLEVYIVDIQMVISFKNAGVVFTTNYFPLNVFVFRDMNSSGMD